MSLLIKRYASRFASLNWFRFTFFSSQSCINLSIFFLNFDNLNLRIDQSQMILTVCLFKSILLLNHFSSSFCITSVIALIFARFRSSFSSFSHLCLTLLLYRIISIISLIFARFRSSLSSFSHLYLTLLLYRIISVISMIFARFWLLLSFSRVFSHVSLFYYIESSQSSH